MIVEEQGHARNEQMNCHSSLFGCYFIYLRVVCNAWHWLARVSDWVFPSPTCRYKPWDFCIALPLSNNLSPNGIKWIKIHSFGLILRSNYANFV